MCRHQDSQFPSLGRDEILQNKVRGIRNSSQWNNWYFAYNSLKKLNEAFTKEEIREFIEDMGFRVFKIEAKDIGISKDSVSNFYYTYMKNGSTIFSTKSNKVSLSNTKNVQDRVFDIDNEERGIFGAVITLYKQLSKKRKGEILHIMINELQNQ